jgi:hypothetical protein
VRPNKANEGKGERGGRQGDKQEEWNRRKFDKPERTERPITPNKPAPALRPPSPTISGSSFGVSVKGPPTTTTCGSSSSSSSDDDDDEASSNKDELFMEGKETKEMKRIERERIKRRKKIEKRR